MGRAPCCSKVGLNKGPWTPEEDALLCRYIEAHGEGRWKNLPTAAGLLRCGKSCRLRWVNYLRPTVKRGNISEDEEDLIIKMHSLLGNRWCLIAGRLPGRTDNEIKNYWNTCLSKKLVRKGIDPITHKLLGNSACAIHADVYEKICQLPLKSLDPECTEKVPCIADSFVGPTLIVSEYERDFLTEPSSIDSCEVLNKLSKEASSSYGSPRSLDFVMNDHPVSFPNYGSFEGFQNKQPDRSNSPNHLNPVSLITLSWLDGFAYHGTHSPVVRDFFESSASKCTSSFSDNSTTSRSFSIANVSTPRKPDIKTNSKEHAEFPSREQYTFEPKNAVTLLLSDSEMEKTLNQKENLSDGGTFIFPPDSADACSIRSGLLQFPDEPLEKEIWNFVDKFTTGEPWETLEPFTHFEHWNVPGWTTTSSMDFQVNLGNFINGSS